MGQLGIKLGINHAFPSYLGRLRKPLEVIAHDKVSMKNVTGPSHLVVLSRKSFPSSFSVQSLRVRSDRRVHSVYTT